MLLNRPHPCNRPYHSETVNDADALLVNAWRSIQFSPDATAEAASWPVTEADKSARQIRLLRWREEKHAEIVAGDPTFHDPIMGGWWLWAVAVQIGAFSGDGAWTADPATGRIVKMPRASRGQRAPGVARDRPGIINNGAGVNGPVLRAPGVARDRPFLNSSGQGVNGPVMRAPGVSACAESSLDDFHTITSLDDFHPITMPRLRWWMRLLSARLRHVRILNGDWSRAVTSGVIHTLSVRTGGVCGVFLDPPYANEERASGLYAHDCGSVAAACRAWALEAGRDPRNRIVLAGYDVEHTELEQHGWTVHEWFTRDSILSGGINKASGKRERLWASPHCLRHEITSAQRSLFDALA